MPEFRLQMRVIYLGRSAGSMEQFRFVRDNGWGGKWQSTVYNAWIDLRRLLKADG